MSVVSEVYSAGLLRLIEANAPYWGAEAEIIRSYWDAPARTAATDRKWLIRQVYKEYRGVLSQLERFRAQLPAGLPGSHKRPDERHQEHQPQNVPQKG